MATQLRDVKECECRALSLFTAMVDAYDMWLNNNPGYEHKMSVLSKAIHEHLRSEFNTDRYGTDLVADLSLMEGAIVKLKEGKEKPMAVMEIVRNTIHRNDALKQLAVCGGSFHGVEQMPEAAQVLRIAFHLLEEEEPATARVPLVKAYTGLDCWSRISKKNILWFNEVNEENSAVVGGKGANLAEIANADVPVPPGFTVTSTAYFNFLNDSGANDKIRVLITPLDVNNTRQLDEISAGIQQLILNTPMPLNVAKDIQAAYEKMDKGLVAVRSSATAEDLPEASFAGQQRSYLNVSGDQDVVGAVQKCWASLFTPRAIFYREENHFDQLKVGIAVVVQRMVQAEASGIMFTVQPEKCDDSSIVIEAAHGLGEPVASGEITPDHYIVSKPSLQIIQKQIKPQQWKLVKDKGRVDLGPGEQAEQKIDDNDIRAIAKMGKELEEHYQSPQDVEWAKEAGQIFIVQTRPITTIAKVKKVVCTLMPQVSIPPILSGMPASPGQASGPVKIVLDLSQLDQVMEGDILVAPTTAPDFVTVMRRAAAVITDYGGTTAHAAIVSRELGIPCVVDTRKGTLILKNGQMVTVDGTAGKIYPGLLLKGA